MLILVNAALLAHLHQELLQHPEHTEYASHRQLTDIQSQDLWYTTDASLRSTATEHCHQAFRVASKHFSCYTGRGKQPMYGDQDCTAAAAESASAREAGDSETAAVAPSTAAFDLSARGKSCGSLHDTVWHSRLLGFIVLILFSACAYVTWCTHPCCQSMKCSALTPSSMLQSNPWY